MIFMYFNCVFRLCWQLFTQMVAPPSEIQWGCTSARPAPLYPRLISLTKLYSFTVIIIIINNLLEI